MEKSTLAVTLFVLFSLNAICLHRANAQEFCQDAVTCAQCMAIAGCAWCSGTHPKVSQTIRCFSAFDLLNSTEECIGAGNLENKSSEVQVDSLAFSADNQVSVKYVRMLLRVGDPLTFTVRVRPMENFPLDLYLLADMSFSLRDDLKTMKTIANDIAQTIEDISSRFQVGLGTFVDKLTPPYVSNQRLNPPSSWYSACENDDCAIPFSYKHIINLTNSSSTFNDSFQSLKISVNDDDPEGTLDAMLQAVICTEIVGWRKISRKIMLVLTDDIIHSAGDGQIAGIYRPNDGRCHTFYDFSQDSFVSINSTNHDYPSMEQLRMLFRQQSVVPVFAVSSFVVPLFEEVASHFSGGQVVTITRNSDNLLEALQTAYSQIATKVVLNADHSDIISISMRALCPDGTVATDDGLGCTHVDTHQTVEFMVTMELKLCTEDMKSGLIRKIHFVVPAFGEFDVDVSAACFCSCEQDQEIDSQACSEHGVLACGICTCYPGWIGSDCSCLGNSTASLTCLQGSNGRTCSERGRCDCGECSCESPPILDQYNITNTAGNVQTVYVTQDVSLSTGEMKLLEPPRRYGPVCECDNYLCEKNSSAFVCSGEQGECVCVNGNSRCRCKNSTEFGFPFSGQSCQCSVGFCYDPTIPIDQQTEPCFGNGACDQCNREKPCNCQLGYLLPYCQAAYDQLVQCFQGEEFQCVTCYAESANPDTMCQNCHNYSRVSAGQTEDYEIPSTQRGSTLGCIVRDSNLCTYTYYIGIWINSTQSNRVLVVSVEPVECFLLRPWHLAIMLLLALLLLGISLIILIKVFFQCVDRIEFKRFQREVAEAEFSKNINPIYHSPKVEYKNITFDM